MTDVYFVDFIELTLKSKDDFSAAFDIILSTNLAEYRDFWYFTLETAQHSYTVGRFSMKHCKNTAAPPILLSA